MMNVRTLIAAITRRSLTSKGGRPISLDGAAESATGESHGLLTVNNLLDASSDIDTSVRKSTNHNGAAESARSSESVDEQEQQLSIGVASVWWSIYDFILKLLFATMAFGGVSMALGEFAAYALFLGVLYFACIVCLLCGGYFAICQSIRATDVFARFILGKVSFLIGLTRALLTACEEPGTMASSIYNLFCKVLMFLVAAATIHTTMGEFASTAFSLGVLYITSVVIGIRVVFSAVRILSTIMFLLLFRVRRALVATMAIVGAALVQCFGYFILRNGALFPPLPALVVVDSNEDPLAGIFVEAEVNPASSLSEVSALHWLVRLAPHEVVPLEEVELVEPEESTTTTCSNNDLAIVCYQPRTLAVYVPTTSKPVYVPVRYLKMLRDAQLMAFLLANNYSISRFTADLGSQQQFFIFAANTPLSLEDGEEPTTCTAIVCYGPVEEDVTAEDMDIEEPVIIEIPIHWLANISGPVLKPTKPGRPTPTTLKVSKRARVDANKKWSLILKEDVLKKPTQPGKPTPTTKKNVSIHCESRTISYFCDQDERDMKTKKLLKRRAEESMDALEEPSAKRRRVMTPAWIDLTSTKKSKKSLRPRKSKPQQQVGKDQFQEWVVPRMVPAQFGLKGGEFISTKPVGTNDDVRFHHLKKTSRFCPTLDWVSEEPMMANVPTGIITPRLLENGSDSEVEAPPPLLDQEENQSLLDDFPLPADDIGDDVVIENAGGESQDVCRRRSPRLVAKEQQKQAAEAAATVVATGTDLPVTTRKKKTSKAKTKRSKPKKSTKPRASARAKPVVLPTRRSRRLQKLEPEYKVY